MKLQGGQDKSIIEERTTEKRKEKGKDYSFLCKKGERNKESSRTPLKEGGDFDGHIMKGKEKRMAQRVKLPKAKGKGGRGEEILRRQTKIREGEKNVRKNPDFLPFFKQRKARAVTLQNKGGGKERKMNFEKSW